MKTLLATATVSVLLLAACGTAGGTGATKVDATGVTTITATSVPTVNPNARTVNAILTDSKIVLDQATVPSGKITFLVSNTGTMTHEVVVLKTEPVDRIDDWLEDLHEATGQMLNLLIERVVEQVVVDVPAEVDQALLLGAIGCVVG